MAERGGYRTIKAVVLDFVHRCGGAVEYAALTTEVLRHFPASRWKKSHWAYYRYQILHGRFVGAFSETERAALAGAREPRVEATPPAPAVAGGEEELARAPQARDPEVKRIGDGLLDHIRMVISLAAGPDVDKRFKLNRWVFSRLLHDEIRVKRPIKQSLWQAGMRCCQSCGEAFESVKGVEIHRKDESRAYSADNCELLCRECHQELG